MVAYDSTRAAGPRRMRHAPWPAPASATRAGATAGACRSPVARADDRTWTDASATASRADSASIEPALHVKLLRVLRHALSTASAETHERQFHGELHSRHQPRPRHRDRRQPLPRRPLLPRLRRRHRGAVARGATPRGPRELAHLLLRILATRVEARDADERARPRALSVRTTQPPTRAPAGWPFRVKIAWPPSGTNKSKCGLWPRTTCACPGHLHISYPYNFYPVVPTSSQRQDAPAPGAPVRLEAITALVRLLAARTADVAAGMPDARMGQTGKARGRKLF